jgi:hypothetical protein
LKKYSTISEPPVLVSEIRNQRGVDPSYFKNLKEHAVFMEELAKETIFFVYHWL